MERGEIRRGPWNSSKSRVPNLVGQKVRGRTIASQCIPAQILNRAESWIKDKIDRKYMTVESTMSIKTDLMLCWTPLENVCGTAENCQCDSFLEARGGRSGLSTSLYVQDWDKLLQLSSYNCGVWVDLVGRTDLGRHQYDQATWIVGVRHV